VRVLGLDPGSRRTGWGVIERLGNRYTVVAFGQACVPATLDLPSRLHRITEIVAAVMDEHRPACVAVEEAFYHESVRSTLVLGHVRGALLVAAVSRGYAVAEYSPRAIKLAITGSGASAKEQVAFMIRRLLDVRGPLTMDASDGLAVALCHLHRAGAAGLAVAGRSRGAAAIAAARAALPPRRTASLLARKVRG